MQHPGLHLPLGSVVAVIAGQPDWRPWGVVQRPTGRMVDPTMGGGVDPSFRNAIPEVLPYTELPLLRATVQKW